MRQQETEVELVVGGESISEGFLRVAAFLLILGVLGNDIRIIGAAAVLVVIGVMTSNVQDLYYPEHE